MSQEHNPTHLDPDDESPESVRKRGKANPDDAFIKDDDGCDWPNPYYASDGGYRYCICRDCSAVTMTTSQPEHRWCSSCSEAGCELDSECQAPHTYCSGDTRSAEEHWACTGGPRFTGEDARAQALAWGQENLATRQAGQSSVSPWGLIQYCGACGQEF